MWRLAYILVLGLLISSFIYSTKLPSPENLIAGTWQETTWNYEKKSTQLEDSTNEANIKKDVANNLGELLNIHKVESWSFLPNGNLLIKGKHGHETIQWKIKGRGHLLQLIYKNKKTENYLISKLNEQELHLNFETAMQAKGIASLKFKRS